MQGKSATRLCGAFLRKIGKNHEEWMGHDHEKQKNNSIPSFGRTIPAHQNPPGAGDSPHWQKAHPVGIRPGPHRDSSE